MQGALLSCALEPGIHAPARFFLREQQDAARGHPCNVFLTYFHLALHWASVLRCWQRGCWGRREEKPRCPARALPVPEGSTAASPQRSAEPLSASGKSQQERAKRSVVPLNASGKLQ